MLRSILVALDGSPYNETATTLALDWAARFGAHLLGLGVLDEPAIHRGEPVPLGGGAYKKARDAARMADAHHRVAAFLAEFSARSAAAWSSSRARRTSTSRRRNGPTRRSPRSCAVAHAPSWWSPPRCRSRPAWSSPMALCI